MDIRISNKVIWVDKKTGESYIGTFGVDKGDTCFWIKESFFNSKEFDKAFVNVLFSPNFSNIFKKFIIENEGFTLARGSINNLLKEISEVEFMVRLAEEVDGNLATIDVPSLAANETTLTNNIYLVKFS